MTKLEKRIITVKTEHPAYLCKVCGHQENSVVAIDEHFRMEHCELVTVHLPDKYYLLNDKGFTEEVDKEGNPIK